MWREMLRVLNLPIPFDTYCQIVELHILNLDHLAVPREWHHGESLYTISRRKLKPRPARPEIWRTNAHI
jgi:hypothetical protein